MLCHQRKFGFFLCLIPAALCLEKQRRWETKLLDVTKINNYWIFFHFKVAKKLQEEL